MKEFFTNNYVRMVTESLNDQIHQTIAKQGAWEETKIFTTSLDLGRYTGKTEAAVEFSRKVGGFVIYVGHVLSAARDFKDRGGKADLYTSVGSNIDMNIRGTNIPSNRVTVIFDECDMKTSEMIRYVHTIFPAMRSGSSWGKFVHLIRLGM